MLGCDFPTRMGRPALALSGRSHLAVQKLQQGGSRGAGRTARVLSPSFPGPLPEATRPLALEVAPSSRGLRSGAPRAASGASVLAPCTPGARGSPGSGAPATPEPTPRPRPCRSPVALSLCISANRLQTERPRRWVNAIGALPGAQATLPARPPPGAARTSQPAPRRPPRASSAPWAAPERHAAEPGPSPARRGGSRAGRAHGPRDPIAAARVSPPCARDAARGPGEARAETRG